MNKISTLLLAIILSAWASTSLLAQPPLQELPPVESIHDAAVDAAEAPVEDEDLIEDAMALKEPWYYPSVWFSDERWSAWEKSLELGLNGSTGNTETMSFRLGADAQRETDHNTLRFTLTHARTEADSVETQNNALLTVRDDFNFGDCPWSLFLRGSMEYDKFKAFDLRLAGNAGVGYTIRKTERKLLKARFGAGASHEIGGPDDSVIPEANFGLDYECQITDRQKLEAIFDYFPEWGAFDNYRVDSRLSWSVELDAEANLSLKVSIIDRYDSTPQGLEPNDLDYALLLLWKL